MPKKSIINPDSEKYYIEEHLENERATPEETQPIEEPKQYKRNFTDEGREKQKIHLICYLIMLGLQHNFGQISALFI